MTISRFLWTTLLSGLLAAPGLAPRLLAAKNKPDPQPAAAVTGPVVQFSPFEVTARNLKFERWLKISSPHFVIFTDTTTKEATMLLQQMEMLHQATQFFLHRKSLNLAPMIVVLPTSSSDWGKLKSRGGVEWQVATSLTGTNRKVLIVQHDWQSDGLGSIWAMIGLQEAFSLNLDGPLWFRRGISNFFSTVSFGKDSLKIGEQGFHAYYLQRHGWMQWPKFFKVTSSSPEYTKDSTEHDQYQGQCAVFVHYLLTHADPASLPRLLSWSAYLDAGNEPTAEGFKELFHQDWKEFQAQVSKMLDGGTYTSGTIRFPPEALKFAIASGNPTPAEMRELFVLCQILNQDTQDSVTSLDALLEKGLKTEALRELLADACQRRKRPEAAERELRAIIDGGTSNPVVYAEAAELLFEKAVPRYSFDARLADESGEIHQWCKKALEIEPLDVTANEVLAWAEAYAPTVEKHHLETIIRICHTLDQNASTDEALMALAVARWRSGGLKQARTICDRLVNSSFTRKEAKRMARDLLERLNTPPAAPAAPATPPAAGSEKPTSADMSVRIFHVFASGGKLVPSPGSAGGVARERDRFEVLDEVSAIPLLAGHGLSVQFTLGGKYRDLEKVRLVVKHPDMKAPSGEVHSGTDRLEKAHLIDGARVVSYAYNFDEPWELIEGIWTVSILDGDKLLGAAGLVGVLPPPVPPVPDEALPERLAGLCQAAAASADDLAYLRAQSQLGGLPECLSRVLLFKFAPEENREAFRGYFALGPQTIPITLTPEEINQQVNTVLKKYQGRSPAEQTARCYLQFRRSSVSVKGKDGSKLITEEMFRGSVFAAVTAASKEEVLRFAAEADKTN